MREHLLFWLGIVAAFVLVGSASQLSVAQEPGPLSIPDIELTAGLSPDSINQIDTRLEFYSDELRQADEQDDIIEARESLVGLYQRYDSPTFRYTVASRAAEIVTPLLEIDDPQKQINAALVLAQMPQFSMQDALEKMVVHSNPAVRYLGWKGYRNARDRILAQRNTQAVDRMFQSLTTAATDGTSPVVVRAVFEMLSYPTLRPEAVSQTDYDQARRRSLDILQKCWEARCRQAAQGNIQIAEALRTGVSAISNAWNLIQGDTEARTQFLQMIVDAAWSAALAYDQAYQTAQTAVSLAKDDAKRKVAIGSLLMLDCEESLNAVTGLDESYVRPALTDNDIPDRASAPLGYLDMESGQQLGVRGWVKRLEDRGVRQPEIELPTPTTVPAAEEQ